MSFRYLAWILSISLLVAAPVQALRFYVDSATGDNRRSVQSAQNPSTPFKTIAHALRIAHLVTDGRPHVIQIPPGTYSPSSGELFPLEINQPDIFLETTGQTVFDGENKTNFFKITGPTNDFLIKGIDFLNGSAEQGGVAFCQTCSLRVVDNRFFDNQASQNGHLIYSENGRLKFFNNLVRNSGSGNDTLAVLDLRNTTTDTLVRDEIRNNTFYRNPSPNIWTSGPRTYISSNLFIDPQQATIRDANATATPLIGHNLFWEAEILYVSDQSDSVQVKKTLFDTLQVPPTTISLPSFMTNVPTVRDLRFLGDTLGMAELNTQIPSFVKNTPDTLFKYEFGVGYQYLIEVDGFASQYQFKALTLPTGALLDSVNNIPRLILWNPTLNDTTSHPISIEITPLGGEADTLSYELDVLSPQSFPDTTGFLSVRDSTGRFIGMVQETSRIEVPHTAGETYKFTIGVPGNRTQYFFNPLRVPTGVASSQLADEGIIEWATTLADTGSNEIKVEIITPSGDNETLNYNVFVFAAEDFPDTAQVSQIITTTIVPDTTGAITALNALTPNFSAAASAVENAYADPTVLDTTINRFELRTGSPGIDKGTPTLALVDAIGKSRNNIGHQGGPLNGGVPTPNTSLVQVAISTLPDSVVTEGQVFTYNPTPDPMTSVELIDLIPGSGAPTMDPFKTFGKSPPITWTPTIADTGSYLIGATIFTNNSQGLHYFPLRVKPLNEIPVVTSTPDSVALEDQPYSYAIQATDANGDTLSYQINSGPEGLVVDPVTGIVQWTPDQTDVGSDTVIVQVNDNKGALFIHRYLLTVLNTNDPPIISSAPDTTATEDSPFHYALIASDPDPADTLSFSLSSGPSGASVDSLGIFTWTPTDTQAGPQPVVLIVADRNGGQTEQSFSIQVASFDDLPIIAGRPDTTVLEDQPYTFLLEASDEEGGALTYALTNGPESMVLDTTGALSWSPGQADIGTHSIAVQASDPAGQLASLSYELEVLAVNDAPVLRAQFPIESQVHSIQGVLIPFSVSVFDEENDPLTFSWFIGDSLQTSTDTSLTHQPSTTSLDTVLARISDGTETTAFTWIVDGRQIPRISMDRNAVDFGATAIGDTARVELEVANQGEKTLNISSLQVGDLRFSAAFARINIEPGESSLLALSYAPTDRSSSSDSIHFATDDPDNPTIGLAVSGRGTVPTVLSLDLDASVGDQGLAKFIVEAGSTFNLYLYAQRTIDLLSYKLSLVFDPALVSYSGFGTQANGEINLLASTDSPLTAVASVRADSVVTTLVADSLTTGISSDGLLGVFVFTADSSLIGKETSIRLPEIFLQSQDQAQADILDLNLVVEISARPALPGDFNGDGAVGFDDFFRFADHFGLAESDADFDPLFDLVANGRIDLDDFFLLADNFGVPASKLITDSQWQKPMALYLDTGVESSELLEVKPYWTGQTPLHGYALSFEFDPQILGFRHFEPRAEEPSLPWVVESEPGRLTFATGLSHRQPAFVSDLGTLVFDRRSPQQTILRSTGAISYDRGAVTTLEPPAILQLTALPQVHTLYPAYPNPFNPETALSFYLPVHGPIRLRIYDLLGRPVRTLIDEAMPAGFHQEIWQGTDDRGRALSSGPYLVEMKAEKQRQIRKVMLLK